MIVVGNTLPLMNLAAIGRLDILKQLYGEVMIPEAVLQELSLSDLEELAAKRIQKLSWIGVRAVNNRSLVDSLTLELDKGEAEAIVLAMETGADLVLLDERLARRVASRLGLKFIGLLGALVEAKRRGLIVAIKPLLDDLISKAGFWVGGELYARVLQAAGE